MGKRILSYGSAINEALSQAMERDPSVIHYGLGVDDPKGVFGTTLGLAKKFGPERVFDMPTAENGMTGVAIGAALGGVRPVMVHQRLDFFLLALDQLVNNAAKWHYMFGDAASVPLTIRLIIGRGWGQGPTHSQSLHSWFAHVPGLKVVMPTTPYDAKGLLLSCIADPNPTLFLEHRWLHGAEGFVPEEYYEIPIGEASVVRPGTDITIVSMAYQTIEALHALEALEKQGVSAELIDLRSVSPVDWKTVFASVEKTGRLLALDIASETCSLGSEIISKVARECFSKLKCPPALMALPDYPSPTSFALTKEFYAGADRIAERVGKMLGRNLESCVSELRREGPHDVPGMWFKGPF
jgi:pyruvate dehydrogenase E1 component beta subunit